MHETAPLVALDCETGVCLLVDQEEVSTSSVSLIPNYTQLVRFTYNFLSLFLSSLFLETILLNALYNALSSRSWFIWSWCRHFMNPDLSRPFYELEQEKCHIPRGDLKFHIAYYAQRIGLDCEEFKIEMEDGFILTIQHIIDRHPGAPDWKCTTLFDNELIVEKYPVLLLHGLMQSAEAFCVNDDSSLAFYLCKEGYDVWLGNNRGYSKPEHVSIKPSDH